MIDTIDCKYNKLTDILNSKTLNYQEKVKELEKLRDLILKSPGTGKKVYKKICGTKVYIPKKYIGKYTKICQLLNKYASLRFIKENSYSEQDIIEYKQALYDFNKLSSIICHSPVLMEEYQAIKHIVYGTNKPFAKKVLMMRKFINDNIIAINFVDKLNSEDSKTSTMDNSQINNMMDIKHDNIIEINKIEKPRNKRKLKRVLQTMAAAFSALLIVSFFASLTKQHNQSQGYTPSYSYSTEPSSEIMAETHMKEVNVKHSNLSSVSINIKNNYKTHRYQSAFKILLGNQFKLKKNSPIYSDMYSAMNHCNGNQSYYSYNDTRNVVGVCIKYNNNLVSIIKQGDNHYMINGISLSQKEANKRINQLLKKGGKINSVLANNTKKDTNSIEGFYRSSDIKVLAKR